MSSVSEMRDQVRGLKGEVVSLKIEIAELNRAITTYVALSRRLGLPPEMDEVIRKALQTKIAIQTLIRSIQLFYATTGPLGWVIAIGGFALGTLMLVDTMEARSPEY